MKMLIKTIFSTLALLPSAALAGHHEGGDHAVAAEQMGDDVVWASGARAIVAEVEGEVTLSASRLIADLALRIMA